MSARYDTKTDKHLRQVCEVGHLLSQICVKLGKIFQARLYCDIAL